MKPKQTIQLIPDKLSVYCLPNWQLRQTFTFLICSSITIIGLAITEIQQLQIKHVISYLRYQFGKQTLYMSVESSVVTIHQNLYRDDNGILYRDN
jgi:hypothetical protein